jgi:hypothetical protein
MALMNRGRSRSYKKFAGIGMELGQIWKVNRLVRFRRLFDEAVLIHPDKDQALVLNDTAANFLEGCDGERSVGEIIEAMTAEFEVSAEQLAQDLLPFIGQLAAEGIIEAV